LAEYAWPILGEYLWPILGDYAWPIIAREMTRDKASAELRWDRQSNEWRKAIVASKHFKTLGVDYSVVSDRTSFWWLKEGNK
jgi:hypothetical protein